MGDGEGVGAGGREVWEVEGGEGDERGYIEGWLASLVLSIDSVDFEDLTGETDDQVRLLD